MVEKKKYIQISLHPLPLCGEEIPCLKLQSEKYTVKMVEIYSCVFLTLCQEAHVGLQKQIAKICL